jgi:hypothetical protein
LQLAPASIFRSMSAVDYARPSLSLLPENPLLLVSIADVETYQHLNEVAIAHAEEALHELDIFTGPSSVREEDWPDVKRRLKASANFSKGCALLQQGLELPAGNKRVQFLKNSEASLIHAQRLNSADIEITYTLGLAQLTAGEASIPHGRNSRLHKLPGRLRRLPHQPIEKCERDGVRHQPSGVPGARNKLRDVSRPFRRSRAGNNRA